MSAEPAEQRRRGPNQGPPWRYDGAVSVLRLPLDVHDPGVRRHLEHVFTAAYQVRRDARARPAPPGPHTANEPRPGRQRSGTGSV